jgi:hypothetical protein
VVWVEELLAAENEREPKPARSETSEVTKIARLLAKAVGPQQATALRKLLEAASSALVQHFIADLQDRLPDADPVPSFDCAVHHPAVGM